MVAPSALWNRLHGIPKRLPLHVRTHRRPHLSQRHRASGVEHRPLCRSGRRRGCRLAVVVRADSKAQEKSFAKNLLPTSDFLDKADRKILQAQADQPNTPGIELGEKLDARGNREDYLVFRMLSDDAVHASVNSLRKHLPQNADGMITEFFVEPPHEEIDLGQSLHCVLAGLLNVMTLYHEIVEDPTALPLLQKGVEIFRRLVAASGYDPELARTGSLASTQSASISRASCRILGHCSNG